MTAPLVIAIVVGLIEVGVIGHLIYRKLKGKPAGEHDEPPGRSHG
jgi:hypothetical protein